MNILWVPVGLDVCSDVAKSTRRVYEKQKIEVQTVHNWCGGSEFSGKRQRGALKGLIGSYFGLFFSGHHRRCQAFDIGV